MHSVAQFNYDLFEKAMTRNGVLTPPQQKYPSLKLVTLPPVLKFFNPPVLKPFTAPLKLGMDASVFFTYGYFQQAHVQISEAIITD